VEIRLGLFDGRVLRFPLALVDLGIVAVVDLSAKRLASEIFGALFHRELGLALPVVGELLASLGVCLELLLVGDHLRHFDSRLLDPIAMSRVSWSSIFSGSSAWSSIALMFERVIVEFGSKFPRLIPLVGVTSSCELSYTLIDRRQS